VYVYISMYLYMCKRVGGRESEKEREREERWR